MTEHLGDDLSPKPDPILGPSLSSQSSVSLAVWSGLPSRAQSHRKCHLRFGAVRSPPGCVPPSAGSLDGSYSPAINRSSGPRKAHIQGLLCAWHWVLCFASTQVGGPFSPFTEAAVWLGRGLRSPWGACCWLLSALLNGRDPCRQALCCHGSPAVNERL